MAASVGNSMAAQYCFDKIMVSHYIDSINLFYSSVLQFYTPEYVRKPNVNRSVKL